MSKQKIMILLAAFMVTVLAVGFAVQLGACDSSSYCISGNVNFNVSGTSISTMTAVAEGAGDFTGWVAEMAAGQVGSHCTAGVVDPATRLPEAYVVAKMGRHRLYNRL